MKNFEFKNKSYACEVVAPKKSMNCTLFRVIGIDSKFRNIYAIKNNETVASPYYHNKVIISNEIVNKAMELLGIKAVGEVYKHKAVATVTNNTVVNTTNVVPNLNFTGDWYKVTDNNGSIAIFNNQLDAFKHSIGKTVTIEQLNNDCTDKSDDLINVEIESFIDTDIPKPRVEVTNAITENNITTIEYVEKTEEVAATVGEIAEELNMPNDILDTVAKLETTDDAPPKRRNKGNYVKGTKSKDTDDAPPRRRNKGNYTTDDDVKW